MCYVSKGDTLKQWNGNRWNGKFVGCAQARSPYTNLPLEKKENSIVLSLYYYTSTMNLLIYHYNNTLAAIHNSFVFIPNGILCKCTTDFCNRQRPIKYHCQCHCILLPCTKNGRVLHFTIGTLLYYSDKMYTHRCIPTITRYGLHSRKGVVYHV